MTWSKILQFLALAAAMWSATARADFSFVPGDYYTSNYFSNVITQYNTNGAVVGSYTVPSSLGQEVRGIAFGSDGLLYADLSRSSDGFAVVALDSFGNVHATYTGSTYIAGNLSFGKIGFDSQYLYVCGQDSLTRFLLGNPSSGTTIYQANQIFDVAPLPNGNLLVASAYHIDEITTAGVFVRTIPLVGDDNSYTDIRGIAYNPATNTLFVTELGHTGFFFQLMRIDAATGILQGNVTFNYADDLFLDSNGNLLVGSRTQVPRFYSQDLQNIGMLGGDQQMFVTQFVPEPATISSLLVGAALLAVWHIRRIAARPG